MIPGWVALALCVFLNWMLVKGIHSIAVIQRVDQKDRTRLHGVFERSAPRRFDSYAFWQNQLFVVGVAFVAAGLLANVAGFWVAVISAIVCFGVLRVIVISGSR